MERLKCYLLVALLLLAPCPASASSKKTCVLAIDGTASVNSNALETLQGMLDDPFVLARGCSKLEIFTFAEHVEEVESTLLPVPAEPKHPCDKKRTLTTIRSGGDARAKRCALYRSDVDQFRLAFQEALTFDPCTECGSAPRAVITDALSRGTNQLVVISDAIDTTEVRISEPKSVPGSYAFIWVPGRDEFLELSREARKALQKDFPDLCIVPFGRLQADLKPNEWCPGAPGTTP